MHNLKDRVSPGYIQLLKLFAAKLLVVMPWEYAPIISLDCTVAHRQRRPENASVFSFLLVF